MQILKSLFYETVLIYKLKYFYISALKEIAKTMQPFIKVLPWVEQKEMVEKAHIGESVICLQ